jgi:hypothetical protein
VYFEKRFVDTQRKNHFKTSKIFIRQYVYKKESKTFYKEFTSKSSGNQFEVYIVTRSEMSQNAKTIAGQILNQTTRCLVFNSEEK